MPSNFEITIGSSYQKKLHFYSVCMFDRDLRTYSNGISCLFPLKGKYQDSKNNRNCTLTAFRFIQPSAVECGTKDQAFTEDVSNIIYIVIVH